MSYRALEICGEHPKYLQVKVDLVKELTMTNATSQEPFFLLKKMWVVILSLQDLKIAKN
jgi:hypothetical protein